MTHRLFIDTPVGCLGLEASDEALTRLFFAGEQPTAPEKAPASDRCTPANATPLLGQAARELEEYFAGKRRTFTVPLAPSGTEFQQAVWKALQAIPYSQTRSYKQIAEQIGRPKACRAVGMANNRNPIAILIPCHRVVGHGGALVGYAGGLDIKSKLLALERMKNRTAI